MNWLSIVLTITVPVALLMLFLFLSKINKNTPIPEGVVMPKCKGCADLTCGQNSVHMDKKNEEMLAKKEEAKQMKMAKKNKFK